MDEKAAYERLLHAIDVLHPATAIDALRLAEAINGFVEARILGLKGCLNPSHIACERCSPGFNERVRKAQQLPFSAGDSP